MGQLKEYPIDAKQLQQACSDVIDALHPYPIEVKVAAIRLLKDTIPSGMQVVEFKRDDAR